MRNIALKWWIVGAVIVVAAGGGIYWYVVSSVPPTFSSYTVARGNVIASVDVPVAVAAEESASLSFKESGEITSVPVTEGEAVTEGTVLATLDTSSLQANVDQAQAALAAAQAKLDGLTAGTRPEQLQADESAVTTAEASLSAAIASAYTAADDAVRNQTDNLFTNPDGNNPIFNVPVSDSQLSINIVAARVTMGAALDGWYAAFASSTAADGSASTSGGGATDANASRAATLAAIADQVLAQAQSYLDSVALAVNSAVPGSLSASTLASYKTDVVTARTEVNAAATALASAENAATGAQNTLMLAQAGATPQDIEAQQAAVLQAQAAFTGAQVALANAEIVAPFDGTVNDLTANVGLVVSPGTPMLTLTNASGLKITGYVSESNVANVKPGESATITLDAFGAGNTLAATVTTVDTSETDANGTPAYQVTLHFANGAGGVKDGMSGDALIVTAEHDNVTAVPTNLILTDNNQEYVLVKQGNTATQVAIGTGISGGGMTEVTSGVNVGDEIVSF